MRREKERRRHAHWDAIRARRRRQQRQWEKRSDTSPVLDHIGDDFAQILGALIDAAARLPECARSAVLHAALARLAEANDRNAACEAVRALLKASRQALMDDPWFRFHLAGRAAEALVCDREAGVRRRCVPGELLTSFRAAQIDRNA